MQTVCVFFFVAFIVHVCLASSKRDMKIKRAQNVCQRLENFIFLHPTRNYIEFSGLELQKKRERMYAKAFRGTSDAHMGVCVPVHHNMVEIECASSKPNTKLNIPLINELGVYILCMCLCACHAQALAALRTSMAVTKQTCKMDSAWLAFAEMSIFARFTLSNSAENSAEVIIINDE